MEILGNAILQNSAMKFYCQNCHYGTCRKSSYSDHLLSSKHHKKANGNTYGNTNPQNNGDSKYSCNNCKKEFKNRSGLWKHKQICYSIKDKIEKKITFNKNKSHPDLIMYLIQENKEIKQMLFDQQKDHQNQIFEVIRNGTRNNNSTNTNTNSHNKTFNLQLFLNETCKDAMNIMDFVDSIKLQLSDLENVGKVGFVEGISNIIVKNLNALDISQRPVHCTDKKREVMYVKDHDKWAKDENNNNKIRKAIKRVVCKNQRLIPKFKEAHPDCNTYHSKFSDQYNKIIVEAMGSSGDVEKEEKIIRNISKIVTIDKEEA
jgi:hypothetical protein